MMNLLLLSVTPFLFIGVHGHGFMSSPRSRNYVANIEGGWSGTDPATPAKETCHHCLNIPSVCGTVGSSNYDAPKSAAGGLLAQPRIQATYTEGDNININVMLTAHHKGHFTFKVCPVQPYEVPTQACFDAHPLIFVSDNMYGGLRDPNYPERAYIANPNHPNYTGEFKYTFTLPPGVSGDMVLMQWHWISANSCLPEGYDRYNFPPYFEPGNAGMCSGGNFGEQFWNCAEITIRSRTPSAPVAQPVPSPVAAPIANPTPVAAPVATPVAAPVSPPVSNPTPVAAPTSQTGCASPYVVGYAYAALEKASSGGKNYECKPHPSTPWCKGEAWAYAPGSGAYWEQAWNLIGACSGAPSPVVNPVPAPVSAPVATPTKAPVPPPLASPTKAPVSAPVPIPAPVSAPVPSPVDIPTRSGCAPAYVEGHPYVAGDKASNGDMEYTCKPYPYTGWCKGAAWAYAPGTGTAWQDAWTLVGACGEQAPSPVAAPVPAPVAAPVPSPVVPPVSAPVAAPVPSPVAAPVPAPVAPVPSPVFAPVPTIPTAPVAPPSASNAIQGVERVLDNSKVDIDKSLFLYQTPQSQWAESTVYRFQGFLAGLRVMYEDGVAGKYFYMGEDGVTDGHTYGLVNIAAFLAQSMKETIKYDACDENSWDLVNSKYPLSNACGQLGQSYQDYHCSAAEKHMECPVDPNMEIRATTNAKWWGAPQPLYCGPKTKYPFTGYWDYSASCGTSCTAYPGQKGGVENNSAPLANTAGRTDVEGCCWWGRGVIQTTGVCNFGKLNYFLGKRAHDEGRSSRYPTIDFCKDPGAICASQKFQELKWIAGMFYWIESLQSYNEGGWVYLDKLKAFVDGGMTDMSFIDAVSGIVNRGCHNPPCATGPVDGGSERRQNFQKVLDIFKIPGQASGRKLRGVMG